MKVFLSLNKSVSCLRDKEGSEETVSCHAPLLSTQTCLRRTVQILSWRHALRDELIEDSRLDKSWIFIWLKRRNRCIFSSFMGKLLSDASPASRVSALSSSFYGESAYTASTEGSIKCAAQCQSSPTRYASPLSRWRLQNSQSFQSGASANSSVVQSLYNQEKNTTNNNNTCHLIAPLAHPRSLHDIKTLK